MGIVIHLVFTRALKSPHKSVLHYEGCNNEYISPGYSDTFDVCDIFGVRAVKCPHKSVLQYEAYK